MTHGAKLYEVTIRNRDTGEIRSYEVAAHTKHNAEILVKGECGPGRWTTMIVRDTLFRSAV